MCPSRPRRIAGLWHACAVVCLVTAPASAQTVASVPRAAPAAALPPIQGVKEALDRAHRAKNLGELNGSLTNESAAGIGFALILMDLMVSGLTGVMAPKTATDTKATEKAFQDKVVAMLGHYSLNKKTMDAADKSGTLPPGLALRGHQFLADALTLDDAYEKTHPAKEGGTFGSQMGGDKFPLSSACDFQVLSPTRVRIVPRRAPESPAEARLESGEWRLDAGGGTPSWRGASSPDRRPKPGTITPQAAALQEAIGDGDEDAVRRDLKADPALANSPPTFYHGTSGSISGIPLMEAAFRDDPKIVALLLQYGADVGTEDDFGENALDEAVHFDHKDMVVLLIAHGAKVRHKDRMGETALHIAAGADYADIAALLLAHGADVNARDNDGRTPLAAALASTNIGQYHEDTVSLLRRHGAKE